MPPCNVFQSPAREGIEVTPAAYAKRSSQIASLLVKEIRPDVIAFQEVSGVDAVREALGSASNDFHVCSFGGSYKIQRLAFAWRKRLGVALENCADVKAISLPDLPVASQVRPGLILTLRISTKTVRFLTLHLKSGCVSALENDRLDGNAGPNDPCPILQQQVSPIESALEKLGVGVDSFVVLGDFNRNLWHEANLVLGAEAIRSDGETDLTKPRAANVLTRNLLREVNDGTPPRSKANLLAASCTGSQAVVAACEASKFSVLSAAQRKVLTAKTGLGCRNPVGLDHILVSENLIPVVRMTTKISIGQFGTSLAAKPPTHPEPLLSVSDHCPLVVELEI